MNVTAGGVSLDKLEKMKLEEIGFWLKTAVSYEKQKIKAIEDETSL